jgi:hypothetical protein
MANDDAGGTHFGGIWWYQSGEFTQPDQEKTKQKQMTQANHTLHSNQVVEGDQNAPLDISFLTYQS